MSKTKEKSSSALQVGTLLYTSYEGNTLRKENSTKENTSQIEYTETKELLEKFKPKKSSSQYLADIYEELGFEEKGSRVRECGSLLEFAHEIDMNGEVAPKGKLKKAYFCRDRLCPMCNWRRTLKVFGQVSKIMDNIGTDFEYLFLTLTIPNVEPESLNSSISELMKAWNRFIGYKRIEKAFKGFVRVLEITRNSENGTYHPHFHIVVAVNRSYFTSRDYIRRDEFLELWQRATKNPNITQVDVRKAKPKVSPDTNNGSGVYGSVVAELAKYAVKDNEYLSEDKELSKKVVKELGSALKGRRLIAFGGIFKELFEKLRLEDCESEQADLTHINETIRTDLALLILRYGWTCGTYKFEQGWIELPPEPHKTE